MKKLNGHLEGIYTLLAPMSHIGESHGIDSYLATEDIIGADGKPVEIFIYSGNAIRGMLRDCGAKYFLDKISMEETMQVTLPMFYFLFAGGTIGGDQKIDIDQARNIRKNIPVASIFGGGVGNQILAGKLCCNDAYPVSHETMHIVPGRYYPEGEMLSWRQMTTERSYTRMDDAKDERKRPYIAQEVKALEGLFEEKKPKKEKDEQAVQMRYTVEVMQVGTKLYHRLDVRDLSEIEMGALVSSIYEWTKSPYLGGKSNIGMGRATVDYVWKPFEEAELPFLKTEGDEISLGAVADETKQAYDTYLKNYKAYLSENRESLVKMLE